MVGRVIRWFTAGCNVLEIFALINAFPLVKEVLFGSGPLVENRHEQVSTTTEEVLFILATPLFHPAPVGIPCRSIDVKFGLHWLATYQVIKIPSHHLRQLLQLYEHRLKTL